MWPELIAAAASFGGELAAGKSNRAEAERNRRFQERMSSTAAQRSVKDFKLAGLNPALAYGTTASSPSGSVSTVQNAGDRGVSSALGARRTMEELRMAREQNAADLRLKEATTQKTGIEAANSISAGNLLSLQNADFMARMKQTRIMEPFQARQSAADALLTEYLLPSAGAESRLATKMGIAAPILKQIMQFGGRLPPVSFGTRLALPPR